jgi:tetratricopeptide (TPR) repeat protein
VVAVAIAFFFAGHLIESTFLPLELYFEHRNYLPAMLMGLPLAWYLVMATQTQFHLRIVLAFAIVSLLATETGIRAHTWGHPFTQALVWAKQNPGSPRAQNHLASLWQETGNTQEAIRLLTNTLLLDPDNFLTKLNLTIIKCRTDELTTTDIISLRKAMHAASTTNPVQRYQLKTTIERLREYSCGEWSPETYFDLLRDTINQPNLSQSPVWRQTLLQLYGQAALERQLPNDAYQSFLAALQELPSWQGILKNSALLASAGHPHLALSLMDLAPRPVPNDKTAFSIKTLREKWLGYTGYYVRELAHLRNVIMQDI